MKGTDMRMSTQLTEGLLRKYYGQECVRQFKQIARKVGMEVEEVVNVAVLIALSNNYDPRRGGLENYLWATLRIKVAQLARPAGDLQLDAALAAGFDCTEVNEGSKIPVDVYQRDWSMDPELQHMIDTCAEFSGKSAVEIARLRGCTRRNFNYQLKKLCREAEKYQQRQSQPDEGNQDDDVY